MENVSSYRCRVEVRKKLPGCEHSAMIPCHRDPGNFTCSEPCGGALQCCSKTCKNTCFACQRVTRERTEKLIGRVQRTFHVAHPCDRTLYCEHKCGLDCSKDHECNTSCSGTCRQQCVHHKCPKPCSEPCAPCMEPCTWTCWHMQCPVLCGSVSSTFATSFNSSLLYFRYVPDYLVTSLAWRL